MNRLGGHFFRSGWRGFRLVLITLAMALVLSGCLLRVAYQQLDWLVFWYVDDYFDLNKAQETQVKAAISRTLVWHRINQLPRYADLSRRMERAPQEAINGKFFAARYGEIIVLWDEFLRQVSPDMVALLKTLSDEQVNDVLGELAKENRKLAKDYGGSTAEERRGKQDKVIIKAFPRFTGRLTEEQEGIIRRNTAQFHDLAGDWLERRLAWQEAVGALLADRQRDPQFGERFTFILLNPNQFDSPRYRELVLENQQRAFQLVAEVVASLSPKQAAHLQETFLTYTADLEFLMRQTPARQTRNPLPDFMANPPVQAHKLPVSAVFPLRRGAFSGGG